jgi:hypothetical protein
LRGARALNIDKAGGCARRLRGRRSSVTFACRLSLDAGGNRHAIAILAYDRGKSVSVNVQTVYPRKVAAVRREAEPGAVGSTWGPALGTVWDFIRSQTTVVHLLK